MKIASIASLLLANAFAFQDVASNLGDRNIIEVDEENLGLMRNFYEEHLDVLHVRDGKANVLVPKHVVSEGKIDHIDVTDEWVRQLQENFDTPNFFCQDSPDDCAARNAQSFYSSYQSLAALTTRIGTAVANSNGLGVRKTIGQTTEGRPMHVVEIGDQSKPLAMFMCNVHAREWLSPMYCSYMIEKLLENGGHRILDTFSFAIVPAGNPDGYEYSRTRDSFWRKTRNINPGSRCIGTDPNRNWANNHCGPGTSNNPCSDIYCGPQPFSTPEINAVNSYARQNANRLITWIDFHSYASMWLSPLGYKRGTPPAVDYDRMFKCMTAAKNALRAVNGLNYRVGGAADLLGAAAGASDDHFYFEFGVIYSFTVEMRGNSFQPSASNIDPNNRELFAGMIGQMDCIAETENIGRARETVPEADVSEESVNEGMQTMGMVVIFLGIAIVAVGVVAGVLEYKRSKANKETTAVEPKPEL